MPDGAERTVEGGCLCGGVRYEVKGPATEVVHCHCSMCRKGHGAAFATYGGYLDEKVRLTAGDAHLRAFQSGPMVRRQFCGTCGSTLFWHDTSGRRIWVALGTLEGDPGREADCHIFVGSKAPWFDITDGLPQHEAFPPH